MTQPLPELRVSDGGGPEPQTAGRPACGEGTSRPVLAPLTAADIEWEGGLQEWVARTRRLVRWEEAGVEARGWWEGIEVYHHKRPGIVRTLALELGRRRVSLAQYHKYFKDTQLDNFGGLLAFADYQTFHRPRKAARVRHEVDFGWVLPQMVPFFQRYSFSPGRVRQALRGVGRVLGAWVRAGRVAGPTRLAGRLADASFGALSRRAVLAELLKGLPRPEELNEPARKALEETVAGVEAEFAGARNWLAACHSGPKEPAQAGGASLEEFWRKFGWAVPAESAPPAAPGSAGMRPVRMLGRCSLCGTFDAVLEAGVRPAARIRVCANCAGGGGPDPAASAAEGPFCGFCGRGPAEVGLMAVAGRAGSLCAACRDLCRGLFPPPAPAGSGSAPAAGPAARAASAASPPADPAPALTKGGMDTVGWDVPQLLETLGTCKVILKWDKASTQARGWWAAFETDQFDHLQLVMRLAQEVIARKGTLEDLYRAYLRAGTDNMQAVVSYLEFLRLKGPEKGERAPGT